MTLALFDPHVELLSSSLKLLYKLRFRNCLVLFPEKLLTWDGMLRGVVNKDLDR